MRIQCFKVGLVMLMIHLFIAGNTFATQPFGAASDSTRIHPVKKSTSRKIAAKPIRIFKNKLPESGYGYDILLNGKVYVHQPNIPAVQGNQGFATKEKAYKTAGLVLYKIRHKILPPSVDVKELDSLRVLK